MSSNKIDSFEIIDNLPCFKDIDANGKLKAMYEHHLDRILDNYVSKLFTITNKYTDDNNYIHVENVSDNDKFTLRGIGSELTHIYERSDLHGYKYISRFGYLAGICKTIIEFR